MKEEDSDPVLVETKLSSELVGEGRVNREIEGCGHSLSEKPEEHPLKLLASYRNFNELPIAERMALVNGAVWVVLLVTFEIAEQKRAQKAKQALTGKYSNIPEIVKEKARPDWARDIG